ncbi:hypothetical protein H8D64_02085 [PVC group bacterium]|nr:hypothetical protein [PVC group bacterium]
MKVCKFGGSSVADAAQIIKICDIIASDDERRIVVVSAPGKRHDDDTKVTDLLIACAEARLAGMEAVNETTAVVERFDKIIREMGIPGEIATEIETALKDTIGADT